jgi:hypothetical protein
VIYFKAQSRHSVGETEVKGGRIRQAAINPASVPSDYI